MDPSPSFRSEIYYQIAKFLENGPCEEAAAALRRGIEENQLVTPRYDWTGQGHNRTFRDMEEEYGPLPTDYHLKTCFDLCQQRTPDAWGVQSMMKWNRGVLPLQRKQLLTQLARRELGLNNRRPNQFQNFFHQQLSKNLKLLRKTLGHLSAIYCLVFDRSGRLVLTGADDQLVKCWSFVDGRLIHTYRGASAQISDICVSHDNKLVAAGSCDKVIRVWELHTGIPVGVLPRSGGTITATQFCPYMLNSDGKYFLTSTAGCGTVTFWGYHYDKNGHTQFDPEPTRYHEKQRPGSTSMICASFSPGGVFFCVGSADCHVRVYQMNDPKGPVKILEEEAHIARVDSIQWCNTTKELRFLTGSKDSTAKIWTYSNQRWSTIVLNMKTNDNTDPQEVTAEQAAQTTRTASGTSVQSGSGSQSFSTSRSGRPTSNVNMAEDADEDTANAADNEAILEANRKKKMVTMVAWTMDDNIAITAVSDYSLKLWDTHSGKLLTTMSGHEDEIFVIEPHPFSLNILLTAAHDGHFIVWDISTSTTLFKYRNMIEEEGNTLGHSPVFDAKWSRDGTTICACDGHGHIFFFGHGSTDRFEKNPAELFFHTDYRPLLRDQFHNVVDEQTQMPPHLLPPPFLIDAEGDPYPPYIQRLVRGREHMTDSEALCPIGPEANNGEGGQEDDGENPEERLNRFRNEMIRSLPTTPARPGPSTSGGAGDAPRPKTVILDDNINRAEIVEISETTKAQSAREAELYIGLARHPVKKAKKDKKKTAATNRGRGRGRADPEDDEEEEEEENDANANENGDEDQTSDCSLDESDFSSVESTTDVSSEHSDWGSDNDSDSKTPNTRSEERVRPRRESGKKKSPKSKKNRLSAMKCKQKLVLPPGGDISEDYTPSAWLSEVIPRRTPYFPQRGDVLMYFKEGHERYIDEVQNRNTYKVKLNEQTWMKRKGLDNGCLVKLTDIVFEIQPPRLAVLELAILNPSNNKETGKTFIIKYHDMNDVVDFLVLNQIYNSYKGKHWKKGDRVRSQIDDRWWKGTVHKADYHEGSRKSPFLSIFVHWDNGEKENLSPWDLEALDADTEELEDGVGATKEQLTNSLYTPSSEEWNNIGRESECTRISEAMNTIMELAIAEPFNYPVDLTAYPEYMLDVEYMVDLSLIKTRVENHFYRRIDAIKYDIRQIYNNANKFNRPKSDIVKNAKIITRLTLEIVGDTSKSSEDVNSIYHRLVEGFNWSDMTSSSASSDNDSEDKNDDDEEEPTRRRRRTSSKTNKSSPPSLNPKKWKHDCNELLNELTALPASVPFRQPVSEIEFPDYHRVIATPIDLSAVRESLHTGDYAHPIEFRKDVELIFSNSREYNTEPGAKILALTEKCERWFEKRITVLIHDWRVTIRRLNNAKRKHKAKKQDQSPSPAYKGKGKGKGKGQSNFVRRKASESDEDEDMEEDEPRTSTRLRTATKTRKYTDTTDDPAPGGSGTTSSTRQLDSIPEEDKKQQLVAEDSEDEPLVKRKDTSMMEKNAASSSSEDIPLARKMSSGGGQQQQQQQQRRVKRSGGGQPQASSSGSGRSQRVARTSRRYVEESESEEDIPLRGRQPPVAKRTTSRSRRVGRAPSPVERRRQRSAKTKAPSSTRSGRRVKPTSRRYYEDDDDEEEEEEETDETPEDTSEDSDESEEEEEEEPVSKRRKINRRGHKRRREERSSDESSEEELSGEEAYMANKKTTVTSRGRIVKPNPRIK